MRIGDKSPVATLDVNNVSLTIQVERRLEVNSTIGKVSLPPLSDPKTPSSGYPVIEPSFELQTKIGTSPMIRFIPGEE